MAIRQEKYVIYVRPHILVNKVPVYFNEKLVTYMLNPFADPDADCKHLKTEQAPINDGIWLQIFETGSLNKAQVKIKELIQTIGSEYMKVEKEVPMDALITPIS